MRVARRMQSITWFPHGVQIGEPVSEDLTLDEMRSHMALWAIAKSPLMISADMRCANQDMPQSLLHAGLCTCLANFQNARLGTARSEGKVHRTIIPFFLVEH